jgi:4-hydroxy-3-methylbut-2-enyl diphosphate reductase IspH
MAGASTPKESIDDVIRYLETLDSRWLIEENAFFLLNYYVIISM